MARKAVEIVAALIVVIAFFLPWMEGSGELANRSFSGFDFARLIRNFEITADSPSSLGQIRATAVALYLIPALAVNAVVFSAFALLNRRWKRVSGFASALAACYTMLVLGGLLLLSGLPVSGLADVVGWPSYGLAATAAAAFVLGGLGIFDFRGFGTHRG